MPTLLMFLMFTVVFSNGVVKLYQRVATADMFTYKIILTADKLIGYMLQQT